MFFFLFFCFGRFSCHVLNLIDSSVLFIIIVISIPFILRHIKKKKKKMFRRLPPFYSPFSSKNNIRAASRIIRVPRLDSFAASSSSYSTSTSPAIFSSTRLLRQQNSQQAQQQQQQPLNPSDLLRRPDPAEGMPRYPSLKSVMGCMRLLDYVGTCAFAVSGSLLAATYGLNAFGCTCVGATTALGGGAIRDIIMGTLPVSFIDEYDYLFYALLAAGLTFCFALFYAPTPKHMAAYESAMFVLDTIGLGAFCVIGTAYGSRRGLPLILILLGTVLTCTGGGVVRDLMVRRPVRILNNYAEAYAETVIAGCLAYLFVKKLGFATAYRAIAGWLTVVVARWLATTYNYSLPQAVALRTKYQPPQL